MRFLKKCSSKILSPSNKCEKAAKYRVPLQSSFQTSHTETLMNGFKLRENLFITRREIIKFWSIIKVSTRWTVAGEKNLTYFYFHVKKINSMLWLKEARPKGENHSNGNDEIKPWKRWLDVETCDFLWELLQKGFRMPEISVLIRWIGLEPSDFFSIKKNLFPTKTVKYIFIKVWTKSILF